MIAGNTGQDGTYVAAFLLSNAAGQRGSWASPCTGDVGLKKVARIVTNIGAKAGR